MCVLPHGRGAAPEFARGTRTAPSATEASLLLSGSVELPSATVWALSARKPRSHVNVNPNLSDAWGSGSRSAVPGQSAVGRMRFTQGTCSWGWPKSVPAALAHQDGIFLLGEVKVICLSLCIQVLNRFLDAVSWPAGCWRPVHSALFVVMGFLSNCSGCLLWWQGLEKAKSWLQQERNSATWVVHVLTREWISPLAAECSGICSPPAPPILFKWIITGDTPFQSGGWRCGLCTFTATYGGHMVHTLHTGVDFSSVANKGGGNCDCLQAESWLHLTSLNISKADRRFAPHHLPVPAAHAGHPFAVTSARHRCALSLSMALSAMATKPRSSHRGSSALCPCWRCLHAGLQWENCSFSDVQQTGRLPSLPMKHLLHHRQRYLSRCCLDEIQINANNIIPKAVRGYYHTITLRAGNWEGPSFSFCRHSLLSTTGRSGHLTSCAVKEAFRCWLPLQPVDLRPLSPRKEKGQGMCLSVGSQTGRMNFFTTSFASGHSPEVSHLWPLQRFL